MNDSQIVDLLRALGFGCLAVDIIGDLLAAYYGRPGVTGFAGVALALLLASFAFDVTRRFRTRRALKRLKRELGEKTMLGHKIMPSRIHFGGDQ